MRRIIAPSFFFLFPSLFAFTIYATHNAETPRRLAGLCAMAEINPKSEDDKAAEEIAEVGFIDQIRADEYQQQPNADQDQERADACGEFWLLFHV
ncbi:MAG: hypothetical protein MUO30_09755 [Anaerolineales bacterium]|nr:hypothetical protein [Anaerolineales bacterium]